jgi:asparagine synthase (glutamine-hydrolysing)
MSTRKHVTVALGGDGSDELLAGYPTFIADRFTWASQALPGLSSGLMGLAGKILPVSDDNISLDFKITQFRKGVGQPKDYLHSLWLSSFTPSSVSKLWNPTAYHEIKKPGMLEPVDFALSDHDHLMSQFDRNALVYYKTYLPDDILFKVDRASMLASLEVRAPFLDHTLVEFVNTLPPEYKRKGFTTKRILKQAMKGKLPDTIIERPKKGFGVPLSAWLRKDLRKLCDDLLSTTSLASHGLFNQAHVEHLKAEHYASKKNHRKELWNLMMFQLWYLNHVKDR